MESQTITDAKNAVKKVFLDFHRSLKSESDVNCDMLASDMNSAQKEQTKEAIQELQGMDSGGKSEFYLGKFDGFLESVTRFELLRDSLFHLLGETEELALSRLGLVSEDELRRELFDALVFKFKNSAETLAASLSSSVRDDGAKQCDCAKKVLFQADQTAKKQSGYHLGRIEAFNAALQRLGFWKESVHRKLSDCATIAAAHARNLQAEKTG